MAELSTRDFMPQWQYDHSQDRNNVHETTIQWRGVHRVAEQIRQWEEHHLDNDFEAVDFETRAAALEAHFIGVHQCGTILPERETPRAATGRAMPRVRPQSASLSRRVAENNDAGATNTEKRERQRPQSAKYRSESGDRVVWSAPAEPKASKWREMLASAPDFKQPTLRKLELETYQLLYRTLQQCQEREVQPSARRRKRGKNANNTNRSNSPNKELACGSGLHLARSRKKRQQEHDREMMLGKTRQPSRRIEREKAKSENDNQHAIQDKTRKRGKLLRKKTSQKHFQECQPAHQASKQNKQSPEQCFQRPTSANRARGPWVPAGPSSSLAVRGIPSATSESTQDKRIAQMLAAFQRHANAHLRVSKNVQKQLKKAQQSAKTARAGESRKMEQATKCLPESKDPIKPAHPASASRIVTCTSDEAKESDSEIDRGNQENDRDQAAELREPTELPPPFYGCDSVSCELPTTLKLVIPPLKVPPNLWKYQLADDSRSGMSELSQLSARDLSSNVLQVDDAVARSKAVTLDESTKDLETFSEWKSNLEHVDGKVEIAPVVPMHECRRTTAEDEYLAEGLVEQTCTGLSTGDAESPIGEMQQESQTARAVAGEDCDRIKSELSENVEADGSNNTTEHGMEGGESASTSNEVSIRLEASMSPTKEIGSLLPGGVDATRLNHEESKIFAGAALSDWNSPVVGKTVEADENDTDISNSKEQLSVEQDNSGDDDGRTGSGCMDLDGSQKAAFGSSSIVSEAFLRPNADDAVKLSEEGDSVGCERSGYLLDEPAITVREVDANFLSVSPAAPEGHQMYTHFVVPGSSEVALGDDAGDADFTHSCSDQPLENKVEFSPATKFDVNMVLDVGRHDSASTEKSTVSPPIIFESDVQNLNCGGLVSGSSVVEEANEMGGRSIDENTGTFESWVCDADVLHPVNTEHYPTSDNSGKWRQVEHEDAIPSNSQLVEPTMETMTVEATIPSGTSIDSPPIVGDKKTLKLETKASSPARSPKNHTAVSDVKTTSLPVHSFSPEVHNSNCDQAEEDPLRLHQQEVTRSFLKRVSSRKIVESESTSTQPQSREEKVEQGDQFGPTEPVTAEIPAVVMGVETQLEQITKCVKECERIDGDSVSPLEGECSQALNDCESTIEKYPRVTETSAATSDLATTSPTEKVDTSFTSVDDASTSMSAVTDSEADPEKIDPLDTDGQRPWQEELNAPNNSANSDQEILVQRPSAHGSSDATEVADQDSGHSLVEHHNAVRKIQAQYRCFVRRRTIFDQLRFILAKKRRQTRRKTRQKVKKVKAEDTVENESPAVVVDANSMDNLPKEIQQVAPTSLSSVIGVEIASETPLSEAPEISVEDAKLGTREDSCEYAFDLFDDSTEANGEVIQEVSTPAVEDGEDDLSMSIAATLDIDKTSSEKLDSQQQEDPILPTKDGDITTATVSIELLQEKEVVSKDMVLPGAAIDVEPSYERPAASAAVGGLVTSTTLAQFAFSNDIEEESSKIVDIVHVEDAPKVAAVQPHWERYVDSSTSKSFYYNPVTNESQWTAPVDHAAINPSHASTDTASGQSAPTQEATDTWQEFLDEASGQLYYYNTKTGECLWEPPTADFPGVVESLQSALTAESAAIGVSPWLMYIDPASQAPYYVNMETMATSWEKPDNFVVADAAGASEDTYIITVDDHAALEI